MVNARVSSVPYARTNECVQNRTVTEEKKQSRNLLAMLPRLRETFQSSSCRLQVGFVVRLTHTGPWLSTVLSHSVHSIMAILLAPLRSVTDI